jgi:hypothetical protein
MLFYPLLFSCNAQMKFSEKQKCLMLFFALGLMGKEKFIDSPNPIIPLKGKCTRHPWESPQNFFI